MNQFAPQLHPGVWLQPRHQDFDGGRDLYRATIAMMEAARAMSAAAASPGAAPAISAALAPLDTALGELERMAGIMEAVAHQRLFAAALMLGGPWSDHNAARTLREFEDLTRALHVARLASTTARDFAGPVLAELTRI